MDVDPFRSLKHDGAVRSAATSSGEDDTNDSCDETTSSHGASAGTSWWTVVVFAGGFYFFGNVPVTLTVFTGAKIESDPQGFSQGAVSACESLVFVGWALASALILPFCDQLGRKLPLYGLAGFALLAALAGSLATSLWCYALSALLLGLAAAPTFAVGYTLVMESINAELHGSTTVALNLGYSMSNMFMALSCRYVTLDWSWRAETLLWYSPYLLFFLLGSCIVSESPHFAAGRTNGAPAARTSGKLWPGFSRLLQPDLRVGMAATVLCWVACSVSYFGLTYACGQLSSDLYTNMVLLALIDICGYGAPAVLIARLGTLRTQKVSFAVLAGALLLCSGAPRGSWATVTLALLGRLCADITFTTVYILVVECFPPECRSSANGMANFFARIGTLVAPFFAVAPLPVTCLTLAGLSSLASFASSVLPPQRK